jgi:replicative DNA helicase
MQQLVSSTKRDGRVQEIAEITRGLKTLTKELDVVEQRVDKRPQLSDVSDSGTIEQDADVVMFVSREEYYLERKSGAVPAARIVAAGKAELLVAKRRNGPTGVAHVRFNGATTKFSDDPNEAERRAA